MAEFQNEIMANSETDLRIMMIQHIAPSALICPPNSSSFFPIKRCKQYTEGEMLCQRSGVFFQTTSAHKHLKANGVKMLQLYEMYTLSVKTLKRDDDVECTTTFSFPPGLNENRNLNLKLHNGIVTQSVWKNNGFEIC